MKKIISLLLVLTLILSAFTLAGCSDKSKGEGEELTVCVVVSSAFGDKSFNDSSKEGADKLAKDYGIKVNYIECQEENFKQHMMQAAEESDIVIPVGCSSTKFLKLQRNTLIPSSSGLTMRQKE